MEFYHIVVEMGCWNFSVLVTYDFQAFSPSLGFTLLTLEYSSLKTKSLHCLAFQFITYIYIFMTYLYNVYKQNITYICVCNVLEYTYTYMEQHDYYKVLTNVLIKAEMPLYYYFTLHFWCIFHTLSSLPYHTLIFSKEKLNDMYRCMLILYPLVLLNLSFCFCWIYLFALCCKTSYKEDHIICKEQLPFFCPF